MRAGTSIPSLALVGISQMHSPTGRASVDSASNILIRPP